MNVEELSGLPPGAVSHFQDEGIESLYPPQAEAVEAGATDGDSLVAAVPTASGKTMIAALSMLSAIERGGKALYIVPLRALASEKKAEFEAYEEFGVSVGVTTGNYESTDDWLATRDIVVATSEKVDSLVRNGADWLSELTCVVSDEVHLIDDRNRGPTLEVTLAKLRALNPALQVVALSATVGNAEEIADWLDAALVASDWRPIDLQTGVHYGNAISFDDGGQREVPVDGSENQEAALVRDIVAEDASALVFVNSRRNAEAAARRLANVVAPELDDEEQEALDELADDIRDVSDSETSTDLAAAVEKGAAFHHAGLCVTGDTQILRPNGTFDEIRSIVEGDSESGSIIGMRDLSLTPEEITDTFEMGERPVLTVRTRTGNQIRLSKTHPLPVLRKDGVEWVPASEIENGSFVARPREIRSGIESAPSFRRLVPGEHFVYREYETVKRLSKGVEEYELPRSFYDGQTYQRNIKIDDFRTLCEQNDAMAEDLYTRAICDGGQKPVTLPKRVNEEVCWLAGVVAGDGYIDDHGIALTGRSALLSEFDRIVEAQFDRTTCRNKSPSGTPFARLNSKLLADVFAEHFGMPRTEEDICLPEIGLPDREIGAYISGLFDADGSVSPRSNSDGSPCVEFYSTSERLIGQLKTALLRFGIIAFRDERDVEGRITEHNGRNIRSLRNVHRLTIYGVDQLRKFEDSIGFRHSEKAAKLRKAIDKNPDGGRGQNDVIPPSVGDRVRTIRKQKGMSMSDLEPEVPKATLSRFERGLTPMKRSTFQSLASRLDHPELEKIGTSEIFWDRIESIDESGTEPLFDLSTTSQNFVANGIIAHNTSEHRSLVEDAFRDRLLKLISATPTLAAGVNTPARRVIVRDWRRFDSTAGGMAPLSVLEVHQMMGRAGRPGLDPYGEAVLLAKSHDEQEELFDRYIWAEPEDVRSKLAAEPALRTHVLATIASGFASTREGLLSFMNETLYASQTDEEGRLESVTDTVLGYLERNDFIEREGARSGGSRNADAASAADDPFTSAADLAAEAAQDEELRATNLGHTVSRLYLDPMSAAEIVHGLESTDSRPTAMGLYQLIARTPDMYELYLRSGEDETYGQLYYELEDELLGDAPSEYEDARFEDWLSALKTGALLKDWADEMDEDRLTERYSIGPGDLRGKVETAEWLLGAAETLAAEIDSDWSVAVREARARVEHGVREELLELVGVRGVGRKRARQLYEVGVETPADLRTVDKGVVLGALRGRKTAENILENAGREDPSMAGVDPIQVDSGAAANGGSGSDAGGGSTRSGGSADESRSDEGTDSEDQSSLGDF